MHDRGEAVSDPHLTVWYGTHALCAAGINRQCHKLIAPVNAGRIAFRDIHLEPDALAAHGASVEDVRRRLHAIDAAGRLLVGHRRGNCDLASHAERGLDCGAARKGGLSGR